VTSNQYANLLAAETSPYLLQHKDNPVAWRPWGDAAFAEAKARNAPVLLSVGYAACHWCHVMAHESFEDPAVADVMNTLFVNIKLDREERPDVDSIYQHALALLGQQGGWPLTMFLDADRMPFWGGTYFPKTARWGRPGFVDVLRQIAAAYAQGADTVAKNRTALAENLARLGQPQTGAAPTLETLRAVAMRLARQADPFYGGIGDAPKFPQPSLLKLIWRGWKEFGDPVYLDVADRALLFMSQGGIYDHLGGGYARYSVDDRWLVPHFEKMLYDNGQLLELLAALWRETRRPLYRQRAEETVAWLAREMIGETAPDGLAGFAAALDADSEGEEGRFYVWSEAEVDRVLGDAAPAFKAAYDVTPAGNWEGHSILNLLEQAEANHEADPELAEARARLFEARTPRVRPMRDDKVLADWTALAVIGLADAARAFDRPDWIDLAARAFDFVATHMKDAEGGLLHSYRLGRAAHPGGLLDYAAMARAGVALYEATGAPRFLDHANAYADAAETRFAAPDGGWFDSTSADLIVRPKTIADNAVPSGAGVMAETLARLWLLSGAENRRAAAERALTAYGGEIARGLPAAGLIAAERLLARGLQVVVIGPPDAPGTKALLVAAETASLPDLVLARLAPDASLPALHPAHGKTMQDGRPAAYVCEGPVCSPPVVDPKALAKDLGGRYAGRPTWSI